MALTFSVAGHDVSKWVNFKSINITDSIQIKADTMSFEMVIPGRAISAPKPGNIVYLRDQIAAEYVFCGMIETIQEEMINPMTFRYSCDAVDWVRVFDRHLIVKKLGGESIKAIIQVILTYANTGYINWTPFTYDPGSLDDTLALETLDWDFKEPSACLDELAEKVGAQWYIDFDRVLYFNKPESLIIPSPISGNILDLDTDISSYGDMVLTEDISNIKNVIFITDAKVKDELEKTSRFDGPGKAGDYYNLGYKLFLPSRESDWATYITARITSQTASEAVLRTLTDIRPDQGSKAEETNVTIYINPERSSVRLPNKFLLGASERLIIIAYEAIDSPQAICDPPSIALMGTRENLGGDGKYEYKKSEPALWDPDGKGQLRASELILNRAALPLISGSFNSYLSGWKAGMGFTLKSQIRMNNALRDGTIMYVKSVTKTVEIYGDSMASSRVKSAITFSNNRWEGT